MKTREKTEKDKTRLFITYIEGELKRGDVVVVQMPDGEIVKRIAFMPGDRIRQVHTSVGWLNLIGVQPVRSSVLPASRFRWSVIPPNSVFLLGDNSRVSFDSRNFGCIPMDRIERVLVDQRPLKKGFGM